MADISDARARQLGKQALMDWHNSAINYPENYTLTFQQLQDWIDKTNPVFLINFGKGYFYATQLHDDGRVDSALGDLADKTKGQVSMFPDGSFRGYEFFDVLVGDIKAWNVSRIVNFSVQTAVEGAATVAKVGEGIAGISLAVYVIVGALAFYVVATREGKAVA